MIRKQDEENSRGPDIIAAEWLKLVIQVSQWSSQEGSQKKNLFPIGININ
jgi:hypothetical protein